MQKCEKCGSPNIDYGYLMVPGTQYGALAVTFQSSKDKKFFKKYSSITSLLCRDCGKIEIYMYHDDLKKYNENLEQ